MVWLGDDVGKYVSIRDAHVICGLLQLLVTDM